MSQSLSNQNTNAQSMNGLINVNANTITTGAIVTDTIDITSFGTLDVIPTDSTSITDTRLINAGWVNRKVNEGVYVNLTTNQTITSGIKTFNQHINVGDIYYGYGKTINKSNIAIGSSGVPPLSSIISGVNNIALGTSALSTYTTGNSNIGIGNVVGNGTVGSYNVMMGDNSNSVLTQDVNGVVAIGSNTTSGKDNCISIGNNASANNVNSCAIGYNVSTTADNQFKLGRSDQTIQIDGALNVIGSIQTNTIDITNSGTLDIVPTQSTSITDTRLINAGWVNSKISNLTFTNLKIGDNYYGSGNTLGNSNLAISPNNNALKSNTTGQFNIAIGYNSLYNTNNNSNIGIGLNTLYSNTTGNTNQNTVIK